MGQRRAALVRDLPARCGRQPGLLGRDQRRRPPLHGDAGGLRADGRRPAPPDARASLQDRARRRLELRASPRATTTTTATSCARRPSRCPRPPPAAPGASRTRAARVGARWRCARRAGRAADDGHILDLGVQLDDYRLRTLVSNADDWLAGAPTTRVSAFRGDTELASVYAQDTWAFAPQWRATLGARVERWQRHERRRQRCDDDARLRRAHRDAMCRRSSRSRASSRRDWSLKASLGRAVRMPTVAELYQGSIAVERHRQQRSESAAREVVDVGAHRRARARAAAACGSRRSSRTPTDALYSQTNVTVTPNVTNIQNVDEIGTRGLEVALAGAGAARRPARFLGEPDVRAFAHRATTRISRRASASGSRACRTGARTRSRRIASASSGR